MRCITFYSYKGGVGRSLALVNAAKFLSLLGLRVFVIDMDVEAPGLHYKFSKDGNPLKVEQGLVDYLTEAINRNSETLEGEPDLKDYVYEVAKDSVFLLPAGNAPSPEYIQKLAALDWRKLLREPETGQSRHLFGIMPQIAEKFQPDFVLIDARTGITDLGGIAAGTFADTLVCFFGSNLENREGTRAIMRVLPLTRPEVLTGELEIVPVLSRIPRDSSEQKRIDDLIHFLNEPGPSMEALRPVSRILILHSDPALELKESSKVGATWEFDAQDQLLRDYVKLFQAIFPQELITAKALVASELALQSVLDDPEDTTKRLRSIAYFYPCPETLLPLCKVLHLRQKHAQLLSIAADLDLGTSFEPLLLLKAMRVVARGKGFAKQFSGQLEFIEKMWASQDRKDPIVTAALAEAHRLRGETSTAARVYREFFKSASPSEILFEIRNIEAISEVELWETAVNSILQDSSLDSRLADYFLSLNSTRSWVAAYLTRRIDVLQRLMGALPELEGIALSFLVPPNEHSEVALRAWLRNNQNDVTQLKRARSRFESIGRSAHFRLAADQLKLDF